MSYVRHNFAIGQVFKAAHANEMDDGIANNEREIESLRSNTKVTVTEQSEGHVVMTFTVPQKRGD